jgi:hypothetical protein
MRWWLIGAVLGLGLTVSAGPEAKPPDRPGGGWFKDYDKAKAVARQTGKPLFVVFR